MAKKEKERKKISKHKNDTRIYTDTIKKRPLYVYMNLLQTNEVFFIWLFCFKNCDYLTMLYAKKKFIWCSFTATIKSQAPVPKLRKSNNQYLACLPFTLTTAAHPCFTAFWMKWKLNVKFRSVHSIRRTCSLNISQMMTLNVRQFTSFDIAYDHTSMIYKLIYIKNITNTLSHGSTCMR